jgi:acetylornithine deacetylase/succinyl-diaminopimelate desuccinylase-like protein
VTKDDRVERLRIRVCDLMPAAREDLEKLVSFPSVADPEQAPRTGSDGAAAFLEQAFGKLGFELASQRMGDGTTAVIGTLPGPPGAPTALLYSHYDVQPAGDENRWTSSPWTLTERDGRWYGRGSADSKGNVVAHLTALRAVGAERACTVKIVIEGSEEWPSDGIETFVACEPDALRADAVLLADSAGVAVGEPALTTSLRGSAFVRVTVRTLERPVHSGSYGGAAPDALAALIRILDSLRDESGATSFEGLAAGAAGGSGDVAEARFRLDAGVLEGVGLMGTGTIGDRIWRGPSVTVIGIDCPSIAGSIAAIPAEVEARLLLRVPPGASAEEAERALIAQIHRATPWNARVETVTETVSEPCAVRTDGEAFVTFEAAMSEAYGRSPALLGQGGSMPICTAFAEAYPAADLLIFGVEEPACAMHSFDESVDPGEIQRVALAEAIFLSRFGSGRPC